MKLFSTAMKDNKKMPLKTAYYSSFIIWIVIPILMILIISIFVLNQQFKKQAVGTIKQAQETIITELLADINSMSMRLSHLINTNNNEILGYAAGTDDISKDVRYEYEQKLSKAGNLVLEPVKDIVSVGFYMKNGSSTYIKNSINRSQEEIRKISWYQKALKTPNRVCVGSFDTRDRNDLYSGGKKNQLILVFALAPDVTTDRSQKVEMVTFYQSTKAGERINYYNKAYMNGDNKLGIARITDENGTVIFSSQEEDGYDFTSEKYTKVVSSIRFNDVTWQVENYIKTSDFTSDFRKVAVMVLGAAMLVLLLAGYFSRYFLLSIIKPVEDISKGLKEVEEGNLEAHIVPSGQFEIRNMIYQFNAMTRRLKVLIQEYEERFKSVEKKPRDYFVAMLSKEMTPEEVNQSSKDFFMEHYTILGFYIENDGIKEKNNELVEKLSKCFERNPRFTSRCISGVYDKQTLMVFYRITETDYVSNIERMAVELQKMANTELDMQFAVCIGQECFGFQEFKAQVDFNLKSSSFRHLWGGAVTINLNQNEENRNWIIDASREYEKLAESLYIADEKNMTQEKEHLLEVFNYNTVERIRMHLYAAILAVAKRFTTDNGNFSDVFGQKYNYIEKIERIGDIRNMKLWVINYLAWIMDYSATKLNVTETDLIVKAKRFIADHYEDADLTLTKVADYVDLNEKYFTNRFTKEAGETFSNYLMGLRIQKSKELLKTTSFKVYEIAEMVGYHNVEHFNRMFKKICQVTPAQYRKTM